MSLTCKIFGHKWDYWAHSYSVINDDKAVDKNTCCERCGLWQNIRIVKADPPIPYTGKDPFEGKRICDGQRQYNEGLTRVKRGNN